MSRFDKPWVRIALILAILFVGLFGLAESVRADSIVIDGESIPADQVIDNDAIISGEDVVVDGTVLGDVFAFGNAVTINGKIDGSLFSAAETITINGQVTGTIYVAGGTLKMGPSATASRNALFVGFRIVTESGSVVGRDLLAIGIGAQLSGSVGRDLNATIGLLEIIGIIRDSLSDQTGESAGIDGVLKVMNPSYRSREATGAQEAATRVDVNAAGEWILGRLQELVLLFIITGLFLWLKPSLFYRSVERVRATPFPAAGYGLIAYIFGFVGAVLLGIILVFVSVTLTFSVSFKSALLVWALGSSSLFLAFFIFIVFVFYGSKVIVSYLAGRLILQRLAPRYAPSKALTFLLGLTLYVLLVPIPVLGWLMAFVMSLLGLGAVWLVYLDQRRAARAKVDDDAPEAPDTAAVAPQDQKALMTVTDASMEEAIAIGEQLAEQHIRAKALDLVQQSGPWTYKEALGSSPATAFERAVLATTDILAASKEQSVCYVAETDSGGDRLRGDIEYKIAGREIDARWWSITAYDPDHLIQNKQKKHSISKTTITVDDDGNWEAHLTSKPRADENWIHSGGGESDLALVLRLYNPSPQVVEDMGSAELPEIHPFVPAELEVEGEQSDE